MSKTELLPCPFCGSAEIKTVVDDGFHFEQCRKCEATGPTGFKRGDEDDASWNTRAAPAEDVRAGVDEPLDFKSDESALEIFFKLMAHKLAKKSAEWRSGWQQMSQDELSFMLREHVEKGDPVDVANLCMMLCANGQRISPLLDSDSIALVCAEKIMQHFDTLVQAGKNQMPRLKALVQCEVIDALAGRQPQRPVVMPKQRTAESPEINQNGHLWWREEKAADFNACLDEFDRLNPQ